MNSTEKYKYTIISLINNNIENMNTGEAKIVLVNQGKFQEKE